MASSPCVSCGRPADQTAPCPHCGYDPLLTELARLDRDIAEMSAQDVRLQKELKDLSARMQVAQHQRVLLAHTQQRRNAPKPRSVLRRRPGSGGRTAPGSRSFPRAPTTSPLGCAWSRRS